MCNTRNLMPRIMRRFPLIVLMLAVFYARPALCADTFLASFFDTNQILLTIGIALFCVIGIIGVRFFGLFSKKMLAMYYSKRGLKLCRANNFEGALKACDKATDSMPNHAGAWFNKGIVLDKFSRHHEALKAFDKAIELKPELAIVWQNKGNVLIKLNRLEEALKVCEKAIELKPDYADAWYNKACVFARMNKKDAAFFNLKKAIALNVENKDEAKKDDDLKAYWADAVFRNIVE
ncbi:MAG: hypothetical protein A3J24_09045 [Deltaproteobacteria bacterium RIFCSPLOWO2_02_FULL_53_8]|nr:MAG: hypothetical protein A3J24_09045 [Deltaproteobacteria bacterium RIFCSPLOWO2_02_FULL_53_8]